MGAMGDTLVKYKKFILDLIFPIFCLGCREEGRFLCEKCRVGLLIIPPTCFICKKMVPLATESVPGRTCLNCRSKTNIYSYLSPFFYEGLIKNSIHDLKYKRVRDIAGELSDLLADYLVKYKVITPKDAVIIPIPLHKNRRRERGFNQAELIGYRLSERIGVSLEKNVLIKTKNTKSQVELSAEARRENLAGVFAVKNQEKILNRNIILLDDVKTTGSTLEEAAGVLKSAGAKRIWAVTVAH